MREIFINAIKTKKKIRLTFYSKQDSSPLTRLCAPMDYAPSSRAKDKTERFHFWDYESDTKNHTLSLLPNQIIGMESTELDFNPSDFVTWPTNWTIVRDWGTYS